MPVSLVWLIQSETRVLDPSVRFEFVGHFAHANSQIGRYALPLKKVPEGK
jgi:hypothetical protein